MLRSLGSSARARRNLRGHCRMGGRLGRLSTAAALQEEATYVEQLFSKRLSVNKLRAHEPSRVHTEARRMYVCPWARAFLIVGCCAATVPVMLRCPSRDDQNTLGSPAPSCALKPVPPSESAMTLRQRAPLDLEMNCVGWETRPIRPVAFLGLEMNCAMSDPQRCNCDRTDTFIGSTPWAGRIPSVCSLPAQGEPPHRLTCSGPCVVRPAARHHRR